MDEINRICPFLGMSDDLETNTSYPSVLNFCHHVKPIEVVEFNHQQNCCLSEKHIKCPVFLRTKKTSLPFQFRAPYNHTLKRKSFKWVIIFLIILVCSVLAFIRFSLISGEIIIPKTGRLAPWTIRLETPLDSQAIAMADIQETMVGYSDADSTKGIRATMTNEFMAANNTSSPLLSTGITSTLNPSQTNNPTSTSTTIKTPDSIRRTLDIPIGTKQKFIIHQVARGENLSQYATSYQTSVQAILQLNYSLIVPLWVGSFVVIPVNSFEVIEMPYFQPWQVMTDEITVEAVAKELSIDLNDLIFYNGFISGERLKRGDWVLVPRPRSSD